MIKSKCFGRVKRRFENLAINKLIGQSEISFLFRFDISLQIGQQFTNKQSKY